MECGCGWSGGRGERRKEDAWDEDKKSVIWGHHESSVKPLRERRAGPERRRGWKGERGGVGGRCLGIEVAKWAGLDLEGKGQERRECVC